MPTYDYLCDACGHKFEKFQSMTAPHQRKCPVCGKSKLRRLMGTGAGVIFKGSGFYETDYRSDAYTKAAKADVAGSSSTPPADSSAGATGEAKADKPATKETTKESPGGGNSPSSDSGKSSERSSGDGRASTSAAKPSTAGRSARANVSREKKRK
jgi:putative FmdB family regulatory protein